MAHALRGKKNPDNPVYTDHKWKQFKYRYEVPERVLQREFDWLDEEEGWDQFFKYRDWWYHISEFERIDRYAPAWLRKWDGYKPDSFFSGVVIKISDDMEEYMVGYYIT
jgi:hypothetical protein